MSVGKANCKCHTCGKEFEVRKKCYNSKDASNWAEWAVEHYTECSDCYNKRTNAEKSPVRPEIFDIFDVKLPDLSGTEKQIAWATQIRENALVEICDATLTLRIKGKKTGGNRLVIKWLASHSNSAWWIENREQLADYAALCTFVPQFKAEILSMKESAPQ